MNQHDDIVSPRARPGSEVTRRGYLASVAGAAAATALAPASGFAADAATPVKGGSLTVAYPADPHIYNGFVYENIPEYPIMHNVVSKLLWWDQHGKVVGDLAESWTQSHDLKQITFKLRHGVTWHDGHPFSAEDVVWSLQTVAKRPLSFSKYLAKMTRVAANGPDSVTVTFSEPTQASVFAYYAGSNVILPKHILEHADLQNTPFNTAPVGTGPFRWKQYNRDQSVVLERNPHYYGTGPYLDTLTFQFTPNPSTAILQLQSGAIDMISSFRNLGISDLVALSNNPRFAITNINSTVVQRICFNFRPEGVKKSPWLANLKVRQAIAHAIDRKTICDKVLHRFVEESWGPFARANPDYDSALRAPDYNPHKAEALLDAAGYKRGAGGVRLQTQLAYIPFLGTELTAPAIASMLGQVGIKVELLTADYQTYLAKYWLGPNGQGDTPMALDIGITAPTGDDCRPNYDSRYQPRNNGNGVNIPQVDRLFDEGAVESDPAKQKAIYYRLQKVLSDRLVNVWIGTSGAPNVAHKRVRNLTSLGYWDIEQRWNEVWVAR